MLKCCHCDLKKTKQTAGIFSGVVPDMYSMCIAFKTTIAHELYIDMFFLDTVCTFMICIGANKVVVYTMHNTLA